MQKTRVIPLTNDLALAAADISLAERLAMAGAIVLATARVNDADLLTMDTDFSGKAGAVVLKKK